MAHLSLREGRLPDARESLRQARSEMLKSSRKQSSSSLRPSSPLLMSSHHPLTLHVHSVGINLNIIIGQVMVNSSILTPLVADCPHDIVMLDASGVATSASEKEKQPPTVVKGHGESLKGGDDEADHTLLSEAAEYYLLLCAIAASFAGEVVLLPNMVRRQPLQFV